MWLQVLVRAVIVWQGLNISGKRDERTAAEECFQRTCIDPCSAAALIEITIHQVELPISLDLVGS